MDLNKNDIKKKWLNSWIAMFCFQIILGIIVAICHIDFEKKDDDTFFLGTIFLVGIIFTLVPCYIFSYKKTGTKWLTFFLVISWLRTVKNFFTSIGTYSDLMDVLVSVVTYAICIPMLVWFTKTSIKLLDLNREIRNEKSKTLKTETKSADSL